MAQVLKVDLEWLATGEGQPNRDLSKGALIGVFDASLAAGDGMFIQRTSRLDDMVLPLTLFPGLANYRPGQLLGLTVRGDSMEPEIPDGSLVILDQTDRARDKITEGIYAHVLDDVARLKWMVRATDGIHIRSANRELYPDEFLPADRQHELSIIGRCVGVLKAL